MRVITHYQTTLSASMTSSQVTVPVTSMQTQDGHTIVGSDIDNFAYLVIEPGSAKEEIVKVTGISGSSWTGATRGLAFYGNTETSVPTNQFAHQSGSTVIMSNVQYYYDKLMDLDSTETVTGIKHFATGATPTIADAPVGATDASNKAYVDLTATGGATYDQNIIKETYGETITAGQVIYLKASDALWYKAKADAAATSIGVRLGIAQQNGNNGDSKNILINGIDKLQAGLTPGSAYYLSSSTAGALSTTPGTFVRFVGRAQSATTFIIDSNQDPTVLGQLGQEVYAADSVGTDAYAITLVPAITAYKDGLTVRFKAGTANTGNATLAINGLTAKNILKNYNKVLVTSDILAGQMVEVVYDASNDAFQMVTTTSVPVFNTFLFGGNGSDGALSINAGTTTINLGGARTVVKNYTSISITGTGKLAFSNPHADGTIIVLKSQGNVDLTSNQTPMIDASALGGAGGARQTAGGNGISGNPGLGIVWESVPGITPGAGGTLPTVKTFENLNFIGYSNYFSVLPGAGGCSGSTSGATATSGAGGTGGGALIIECAGAWNFTTASGISVAATNGENAVALGGESNSGGGGGGGGGYFLAIYVSLTANTGTVTVTGGSGGTRLSTGGGIHGGPGGGSAINTGGSTTGGVGDGAGASGGDGYALVTALV